MFGSKVELKSDKEIALMRKAGLVSRAALEAARSVLVPGVTTAEVDAASAQAIADAGATSNFLGYYGYPATVCISVNEVIVDGIPGGRFHWPWNWHANAHGARGSELRGEESWPPGSPWNGDLYRANCGAR